MTLILILLATTAGSLLSVLLAASISVGRLGKMVRHFISLSTGVLLATSLLHVLPEALEEGLSPHRVFAVLLGGLIFFFLLEKTELFRHSHHHEGDGHAHGAHFDRAQAGRGGITILVGDAIHNFTDGVVVAGAFMVDHRLGWLTALAILAHEIPQELGDMVVLLQAGLTRRRALIYNALSGLAAVAGGLAGYAVLSQVEQALSHMLVIAASSMLYVAMADLIPQLQHARQHRAEVGQQLLGLAVGIAVVVGVSGLAHAGHAH